MKSGVRGNAMLVKERGRDIVVYSTSRDVLNMPARDAKPTATERERVDILSVALAQPHRRDAKDPRNEKLATALGRFCVAQQWGDPCWQAGNHYAEIVHQAKNAMGLPPLWYAPGENAPSRPECDGGCRLTQCAAAGDDCTRARKELALMRLKEAQAVLREVMARLPAAMERMVYNDMEPSPYDVGMLRHGLIALAEKWGYLKPQKKIVNFGVPA